MLKYVLPICFGASAGALMRWLLTELLTSVSPIPLGTLTANLVGGYFAGLALAIFANHPGISAEWRLFIVTGFLGGLTTFSTFSAEVTMLLQQGRIGWAFTAIMLHVVGSLLMTFLGLITGTFATK